MTKRRRSQRRCVVKFGDSFRRVLSIAENANGNLLISTHLDGLFDVGQESKKISQYRHSLKVSRDSHSGVSSVHCVTNHANMNSVDRHLVTTAARKDRFQPIYIRSVIHPSVLPMLDSSACDNPIEFPLYSPDVCIMHYALWFTSPRGIKRFPDDLPFPVVKLHFREFALIIPICFSLGSTPFQGKVIEYITTSSERRNDEHRRLGNRVGPAEGADWPAAIGYMVRDFNRILSTPFGETGLRPDEGPLTPQFPQFLAAPVV